MKCPIDGTDLVMADRTGVEIDYCPQCRGVWLDRGELDKIIERSTASAPPPPPPPPAQDMRDRDRYRDDDDYRHSGHRKRRKESFLSDIFDF
ncbi:zf-TFIIB domain-containing protein [Aestuariibius sp. 2305UL40-4]|uniref:TFIIB-type zinc ribbon-containing protein n=1 Tax=Aestuariibius violaceus TaxID=3234132 RepID=UPI00345EB5C2